MGTNKFLYENMFRFADSFRVFVSQCWVLVLGIGSYIFRYIWSVQFSSFFVIEFASSFLFLLGGFGLIFFFFGSFKEGIHNFNDQFGTNCYKKGETIEEFGQKGNGYEVDDGERVNQIGGET